MQIRSWDRRLTIRLGNDFFGPLSKWSIGITIDNPVTVDYRRSILLLVVPIFGFFVESLRFAEFHLCNHLPDLLATVAGLLRKLTHYLIEQLLGLI